MMKKSTLALSTMAAVTTAVDPVFTTLPRTDGLNIMATGILNEPDAELEIQIITGH